MKKTAFVVLSCLLLSACAAVSKIPDGEHWADEHRWMVRTGNMTYVEFYSGIRNALGPTDNNPLNNIARKRADTMILVAKAYEAGKISKKDMLMTEQEQLGGMQKDMNRDAADKQAEAERSARVAAALNSSAILMQNQQAINNMNRPQTIILQKY